MLDNDNVVFLIHNGEKITYKEFKSVLKKQMSHIKKLNPNQVVLCGDDTFVFLVNLFSCIYLKINVVIISDKTKLQYTEGLFIDEIFDSKDEVELEAINQDYVINFLTSGTTSTPKMIPVAIKNLIAEAQDMSEIYDFSKATEFLTSSTLAHHYGCTVCLFLPMVLGIPINTTRVVYPQDLSSENSVFVSTPAFLSRMVKYNIIPANKPLLITSAGAKLEEKDFDELLNYTDVIDMYGCTETGVLCYKTKPDMLHQLLKRVEIKDDIVKAPYMVFEEFQLPDKIVQTSDVIKIISRKDRVVKIQDERVSLTELEKFVNEIDFVEKSYCDKIGEKVGCLVVLNKEGQDKFIQNGMKQIIKDLKQLLKDKSKIIPQKWKFVDEIPKNSFGKIYRDYILELFDINLTLPIITKREQTNLSLIFHRDSNFFKGHFDNYPIVPGVVQLYYAAFYIKELFGYDIGMGQLKKIKFSNLIVPDKEIDLIFTENENSILYKYQKDDKVYSSGQFPKINIFE